MSSNKTNQKKDFFSNRNAFIANLFVLPSLLWMALIGLLPLLYTFYLSFHEKTKFIHTPKWIGLHHYIRLASDERFWNSLRTTSLFSFFSVSLELLLGLAIACGLQALFQKNGKEKFRTFLRGSSLLPWAIPTVISALLWKEIFDAQFGLANGLLLHIGILSHPIDFFASAFSSLSCIIAADVWKTTPFMTLLFMAGLQTIPRQRYEAAQVDGANAWKCFIHITLPGLRSTILVAVLFRSLDALRIFDLVYVLTGGAPGDATSTLSLYAYRVMMNFQNHGYGSALATATFLFISIFAIFFIRLLGEDES